MLDVTERRLRLVRLGSTERRLCFVQVRLSEKLLVFAQCGNCTDNVSLKFGTCAMVK